MDHAGPCSGNNYLKNMSFKIVKKKYNKKSIHNEALIDTLILKIHTSRLYHL